MAIEKKWEAFPSVAFSANGTVDGIVTIPLTFGLYTKQKILLKSNTQGGKALEIKRVLSSTQVVVGPDGAKLDVVSDVSAFTTADSATLEAAEQPRPSIPLQEHERAVYEEEPVVAKRVILVDQLGEKYNDSNRLPVDAQVSVVVPPVSVDLDAFSATPDNVLMVGTEDGTKTGVKHAAVIDANKDLRVMQMGQLVPARFDAIAVTYPTAASEVYTYKVGGTGGTTVAIVTVVYTDSGKGTLSSVART